MKSMTVGQLYFALGEKAPIYLRAVTGKKKVELTNYIRGQLCVLSWEVNCGRGYPLRISDKCIGAYGGRLKNIVRTLVG